MVSLKNPVNDSTDIGAALKRIGFAVTALNNAPVADTRRTLKQFGDKAKLAEVAVVFYSGHALQSDGVAWLLATDGQARSLASGVSAIQASRELRMTDAEPAMPVHLSKAISAWRTSMSMASIAPRL